MLTACSTGQGFTVNLHILCVDTPKIVYFQKFRLWIHFLWVKSFFCVLNPFFVYWRPQVKIKVKKVLQPKNDQFLKFSSKKTLITLIHKNKNRDRIFIIHQLLYLKLINNFVIDTRIFKNSHKSCGFVLILEKMYSISVNLIIDDNIINNSIF